MIFLGNLEPISSTQSKVGLIHDNPFDPVAGMGMTQTQLEVIGILVDSLPAPAPAVGQIVSATYVDPTTKTVTYGYSNAPQTDIETLQSQNAQMLLALVNGGLM